MKINFNKRTLANILNVMTLSALLTQITFLSVNIGSEVYTQYAIEHSDEISDDEIKNMIYNSKNLTADEKEYLYNSDFLVDVLETINKSNYMRYNYAKAFNNIDITSAFDEKDLVSFSDTEYVGGYYTSSKKNKLYVKEYSTLNIKNSRIVSHEFVHLCEYPFCKYNLILEAATEIISSEYFAVFPQVHTYKEETEFLKIFMEIIGTEPIWNYVFLGDFSLIESSVKPYLSDTEYQEFLKNIKYDPTDSIMNTKTIDTLNKILGIMYKNKYGNDIENDEIVNIIKSKNSLCRYYFNSRYINEDYSYYWNVEENVFTLEEAINLGYVTLYNKENEITYDEYTKIENKNDINIVTIASFLGVDEDGLYYFNLDRMQYLPTIYEREKGKIINLH